VAGRERQKVGVTEIVERQEAAREPLRRLAAAQD